MATYTRNALIQYALRALGHPVIEINVAEEQIEDRVDEALEYWNLYHYEGIERMYLKQRVNASKLILDENIADTFPLNSIVTGSVSGNTAKVTNQVNESSHDNVLLVKRISGEFSPGETISVLDNPSISATYASTILGEYDKRYITIPDYVYGVVKILPFSGVSMSKNLFDIQYQLRLHDLYDLTSTSIVHYKMTMNHLALLDHELNAKPSFEFNRMSSKLYPNINWDSDLALGDYFIVECYRALDPEENKKVYDELWLKQYVTALIQKQWGQNMSKFGGQMMLGGVVIDGQAMLDQAMQAIVALQDELLVKSAPLNFYVG